MALFVLKARLSQIQPIGFPMTWDRSVAIEVLAAVKEFIDSVTTHEEDPDVSVSSFASEVMGDIITHIHALTAALTRQLTGLGFVAITEPENRTRSGGARTIRSIGTEGIRSTPRQREAGCWRSCATLRNYHSR